MIRLTLLCLERLVGVKAMVANLLLHAIADERFVRYESYHFRILRQKLPIGRYCDEELQAEIRAFACEAAWRFDPWQGTKFRAFLFKHVSHRCHQLWERSWRKKNYPTGGRWVRNETSWGREEPMDPADQGSAEGPPIEVKEILQALTPRSREVFASVAGTPELTRHTHSVKRLSSRTGHDKRAVRKMLREVRSKARDFANV